MLLCCCFVCEYRELLLSYLRRGVKESSTAQAHQEDLEVWDWIAHSHHPLLKA